jgi:hypothetical protein
VRPPPPPQDHGRPFSWYRQPNEAWAQAERGEALPSSEEYFREMARRQREVTRESAGRWGAELVAANWRSVNHRRDRDEIEDPYEFTGYAGPFDPVAVLRALDMYEYQSCDDPAWGTSEAYDLCEALRRHYIRELPGYGQAQREVTDIAQATLGGTARKIR